MRYIVFAVLLLGLVACESESERLAREERERQEMVRGWQRAQEQATRMIIQDQQRRQMQQRQWAPPPQQPQQMTAICPECRGTGRSSRGPEAGAWPDSYKCDYCQGHGTIIVGQGARGW